MCVDLDNFNIESFTYYTKKEYKDMKSEKIYYEKYPKGKESNVHKLEKIKDIKQIVESDHPRIVQERLFIETVKGMCEFKQRLDETKKILQTTLKEVSLESFVIFYLLEKIKEKGHQEGETGCQTHQGYPI